MNVLILGIDGYIGWSLALHLLLRGHHVAGIDNFSRRKNVQSVSSDSAVPIGDMKSRIQSCQTILGKKINFYDGDILDYDLLRRVFSEFQPQSIVHLAEQPSAPFSMISREHAIYTQHNNVEGSLNILYAMKEFCPDAHLVKLGTMGEYGTPNVTIPEGFFEVEYKGRKDFLPFPRQPNSIYHLSKVHDSGNLHFACRVWNLRATDVMQGVVYGTRITEMIHDSLLTRFDFDESFGTVINRYCAQAVIGHPLTPYGSGHQKRGFIDLEDSIQCLTIAIEKPADPGQYRVFNQLDEVYDVMDLAHKVATAAGKLGLNVEITPLPNPRLEKEDHFYDVEHKHLRDLGFRPTRRIEQTLATILQDLKRFRPRILEHKDAITPRTKWVQSKSEAVANVVYARMSAHLNLNEKSLQSSLLPSPASDRTRKMIAVAIGSSAFDLERTCVSTLNKLAHDGNDVNILIVEETKHKKDSAEREAKARFEKFGLTNVHFVTDFDYSGISQYNADILSSYIEAIKPTLIFVPYWKSANEKSRNLSRSSLIACRGRGNVLMFDEAGTPGFVPSMSFMLRQDEISSMVKDKGLTLKISEPTASKPDGASSSRYHFFEDPNSKGITNRDIESFEIHRMVMLEEGLF